MKLQYAISSSVGGATLVGLALLLYINAFGRSAQEGAPTQPQQTDAQLVSALMQEVKLLRIAIERSNTTMPAFHVLLERTRLQNDVVTQITRDIYDSKLEEERAQLEAEQYEHRVDDLKEKQLASYTPETENEIKENKLLADQQRKRAELYKQQVDRLDAQLGPEQRKLDSFTAELDRLQAELTSAPKSGVRPN